LFNGAFVPGLHQQLAGIRRGNRRQLVQRRLRAIIFHFNAVQQSGVGPAGAQAGELLPRGLYGLIHPFPGVLQDLFDHVAPPTVVPIFSPMHARKMLPGTSKLKTIIGMPLSMQSDVAVASITPSRSLRRSKYSNRSYFSAAGSRRGSAESTPSTPRLAMRITSASTSAARKAAAVSVVKYGLPVPAAKTTTRPFSRCRMARLRM